MDIFCEAEQKLKGQIIYQTKYFFLLHDGYPLMEGHLLLIPRQHRDCFQGLTPEEQADFGDVKRKVIRFLTETYRAPVLFEHGAIAQTIPHAHLHFLPTDKSMRKQIEGIGAPLDQVVIPYLYYEDGQGVTYYKVTKEIIPGFLHTTFAKVLGRPIHGPDRAQEARLWTLQIKDKWKKWLEEK